LTFGLAFVGGRIGITGEGNENISESIDSS
jgi:hypothetical protein